MCVNQFVESMRRLYLKELITAKQIEDLFNRGKITDDERMYILSA